MPIYVQKRIIIWNKRSLLFNFSHSILSYIFMMRSGPLPVQGADIWREIQYEQTFLYIGTTNTP